MPRRRKIKPLLAILSPRDIPWSEAKFRKIDYVDKVWFKYMNIVQVLSAVEKYFREHKEYTHLILNSDDGPPEYEHIAMLIADIKKYDFPVISGTSSIDTLSDDLFLGVTFNTVTSSVRNVNRRFYQCLPNEFRELNGIVKIWFEGNALHTLRRDVVEKVGLISPIQKGYKSKCAPIPWYRAGDLALSYQLWKAGVPQHADLRIYNEHYRYPRTTPPFNLLIGKKQSMIIEEKATAPIPKMKPAKMITKIPQKYQKIMDFYYGQRKALRICIVSEFPQKNFFQWYMALKKFSNTPRRYGGWFEISNESGHLLDIKELQINRGTFSAHSDDAEYWKPIREADIVFVYCARIDGGWEWYKTPTIVKKFMRPEAKMICQFDQEFMWLWHDYWKPVRWAKGKTPEEFFKETGVLDIADAYFTVNDNPLWGKYCSKPIYYMPLPQLFRYDGQIIIPKILTTRGSHTIKGILSGREEIIKTQKRVVILRHSVKSASVNHTLKNVLYPLNVPVVCFSSKKEKLPENSILHRKMPRDGYIHLLQRDGYVGIDDNEGYIGWSRFAFECAISCIPCIGSTRAVKHIFPELYTKPKDYAKQRALLKRLLTDKNFYELTKSCGWIRAVQSLSDANLVTKFLKIAMCDLKSPTSKVHLETFHPCYACYIVYNEADKLAISLRSIVPYVDKIIIVDGAFTHFPHINPQSTDGTKQIAEEICGDKLVWVDCPKENGMYVPWTGQVAKRNAYLELVPDGTWFYILDADVLVTGSVESMLNLLRKESSWNGSTKVAVKMINFYPTLSKNGRKVPPVVERILWEIEDIETTGWKDWDTTKVNWIGYYGLVLCIYLKQKGMKYKYRHSRIYVGDKLISGKSSTPASTLPNILSINMKFLNSFKRHCDMAEHKRREREWKKEKKKIQKEKRQPYRILIGTPFCNEEHSIDKYVEGLLALDYPKELIDLIWIENNSSDNTWELLQKYHNQIKKKYNYHSFRLLQKPCKFYGKLIKQTLQEYEETGGGGKVGIDNPLEARQKRPAHQISIWNFMLNKMRNKHDFFMFIFADVVVQPNTIKRYIKVMETYSDAGWVGGVFHKRYPRHRRWAGQNPMHRGLASPTIKVYYDEKLQEGCIKRPWWVVRHKDYPYRIRGVTEEEVLERQAKGEGIFEVCCTGHVWMLRRAVIKKGFRIRLAPIESGLGAERDLSKLGYKMYCDSHVYFEHISVDGKIYRHDLSLEFSEEEKEVMALPTSELQEATKRVLKKLVEEKRRTEAIKRNEEVRQLRRLKAKMRLYGVKEKPSKKKMEKEGISLVNKRKVEEELAHFVVFLRQNVIGKDYPIPPRPQKHCRAWDNMQNRMITRDQWDDLYGRWEYIIKDEELYARCKKMARQK